MALSEEQKEQIRILVKSDYKSESNQDGLSNRQIAKEVGCSESAVRTLIKKEGLEKNAINALAKAEVQNIINANEIKKRKNALKTHEKNAYDEILLTELQSHNLAMNTNHEILKAIHQAVKDGTKDEKVNVGDGVQNIEPVRFAPADYFQLAKATQAITDSLGITQRHAPKTEIQNTNANQVVSEIVISEA